MLIATNPHNLSSALIYLNTKTRVNLKARSQCISVSILLFLCHFVLSFGSYVGLIVPNSMQGSNIEHVKRK